MGLFFNKKKENEVKGNQYLEDQRAVFETKGDSVKRVFLAIDESSYSGDIDQTKFAIPEYLYDDNYLNDVKYLFNKDVILDYILRAAADSKDKSDWNMIYKPWWQDEHYQKALVLMYYEPAPIAEEAPDTKMFIERIAANLEQNILPFIEEHPETTFTVFYPPYSILYWNNVCRGKELETVIEKYRYMTKRLLEYENVEVFFFQNQEEIICNLNNYADYTHYHGRICRFMVECFANGDCRVTEENLDNELDKLYRLAKDYDYEAIFDDWYN